MEKGIALRFENMSTKSSTKNYTKKREKRELKRADSHSWILQTTPYPGSGDMPQRQITGTQCKPKTKNKWNPASIVYKLKS